MVPLDVLYLSNTASAFCILSLPGASQEPGQTAWEGDEIEHTGDKFSPALRSLSPAQNSKAEKMPARRILTLTDAGEGCGASASGCPTPSFLQEEAGHLAETLLGTLPSRCHLLTTRPSLQVVGDTKWKIHQRSRNLRAYCCSNTAYLISFYPTVCSWGRK